MKLWHNGPYGRRLFEGLDITHVQQQHGDVLLHSPLPSNLIHDEIFTGYQHTRGYLPVLVNSAALLVLSPFTWQWWNGVLVDRATSRV